MSTIFWNEKVLLILRVVPSTWNNGMMEDWNVDLKGIFYSIKIINFHIEKSYTN